MILFFDTSALIKRYIVETGEKKVDELFDLASQIMVSPVTKIEAHSTIKRLLEEKEIGEFDYLTLKEEVDHDFKFFTVLSLNQEIEVKAVELIEKYQLKTFIAGNPLDGDYTFFMSTSLE
jgi:predicted nucleic acid-binding protein